jgi:hypothetical protein
MKSTDYKSATAVGDGGMKRKSKNVYSYVIES